MLSAADPYGGGAGHDLIPATRRLSGTEEEQEISPGSELSTLITWMASSSNAGMPLALGEIGLGKVNKTTGSAQLS